MRKFGAVVSDRRRSLLWKINKDYKFFETVIPFTFYVFFSSFFFSFLIFLLTKIIHVFIMVITWGHLVLDKVKK